MARYTWRTDGEGFPIPSGQPYRLKCCDCGLVHEIVLVSEDGKAIGVAAMRHNRATAAARRVLRDPSTSKSAKVACGVTLTQYRKIQKEGGEA